MITDSVVEYLPLPAELLGKTSILICKEKELPRLLQPGSKLSAEREYRFSKMHYTSFLRDCEIDGLQILESKSKKNSLAL